MDNKKILSFTDSFNNKIKDKEHSEDFKNSKNYKNKIFIGNLGIYYKDFFKKHFIAYECITRLYKEVQIIQTDDSPAIESYRIIIINQNDKKIQIMFGEGFMDRTKDNCLADELINMVNKLRPEITVGFNE